MNMRINIHPKIIVGKKLNLRPNQIFHDAEVESMLPKMEKKWWVYRQTV